MPSSVSNFSIRYHTEDEQLEELYETSEHKSDSQTDESNPPTPQSLINETQSTESKTPSVLGRLGKRSVSLETPIQETKEATAGDTWRLFREVRGRITKTVEEKLEEIKSERMKNHHKKKKSLGQMEHSSVSDSEDVSESSVSLKENLEKNENKSGAFHDNKTKEIEIKAETDGSSRDSSVERSKTPLAKQDDREETPTKKKTEKKRKSKISVQDPEDVNNKTTMMYSTLCDKENIEEKPLVEMGTEATEMENDYSFVGYVPDTFRNNIEMFPSAGVMLYQFMSNWGFILLPLLAIFLNWSIELSGQTLSFILGVVLMYEGRIIFQYVLDKLGMTEPAGVQLNRDANTIFSAKAEPFLNTSDYRESPKCPEKIIYEGWMNEFPSDYKPEIYHVSFTKSVYVRLVGSSLSLAYPKNKVAKRAMWNEVKPKLLFDKILLFDIHNCKVKLLPQGLINRRLWSKKYPINLKLKSTSMVGEHMPDKEEESIASEERFENAEEPLEYVDSASVKTEESGEDKFKLDLEESHTSLVDTESEFSLQYERLSEDQISNEKRDDDSDDEFVKVPIAFLDDQNLYLFARTDREKEIWYRRFTAAVTYPREGEDISSLFDNGEEFIRKQEGQRAAEQEYLDFMFRLAQRQPPVLPTVKESNSKATASNKNLSVSPDLMWFNLFFGRFLYDVLRDDMMLDKIQDKIQRKMTTIKLPFFMEQLVVSHIDFGDKIPIVQSSSRPTIKSDGIWVDLDIIYEGGFKMTIDTKLNLMKLKTPNATDLTNSPSNLTVPKSPLHKVKMAVFDSDIEDSAESSSEEPDMTRLSMPVEDASNIPAPSGKYMRMLETVTQSKYFQHMTDYRVVRNMMEGLSNKNITLLVEVQGLVGTLVLNVPSPPTDRLWYGFRSNPMIWITATPKFGERALTLLNITRLIEKKLCKEFEKLVIMPNMKCIKVPILKKSTPI